MVSSWLVSKKNSTTYFLSSCAVSVVDPHHVDADPYADSDFLFDADPDPTFHPDAGPYPDSDPRFKTKAQTLQKVLK
jgi:hypothetical protein